MRNTAEETQAYLKERTEWREELQTGKMFGVLVVQYSAGEVGYLAAFSGNLAGKNVHPFFVPRSMTYYNRMVSSGKRRSGSMRSMPVSEPCKPLQLSKTHGRGYKARSNTAISYYRPQKDLMKRGRGARPTSAVPSHGRRDHTSY